MPRTPNPVQPRRLDERHYEKALRRIVLEPLMRKLRAGLTRAAAAADVLDAIRGVPVDTSRTDLLVADEVAAQARRLRSYHTRRLIQTFRAALGIDIRPTLRDAAIEPLMAAWRRENIRLVKTIPERLHESLYRRVSETFADRPFDRGALSQMLNREFKSSGYNVRRLARDQTSKAIGQLTRTRHQQLGITEYTWRTAQDERVRDSHVALEGSRQRWDTPPSVGHPGQDVQCFPGSVRIVPMGLQASIAYRYVGELIEVVLANGVEIATTPNHPILTQAGWKRAGCLDKGDQLLVHSGAGGLATQMLNPQFGQAYPLAEDVHRLAGGLGCESRTHGRRIDLHGCPARRDKEVEVVNVKCVLRNYLEGLCSQVFPDLAFESSQMGRIAACLPPFSGFNQGVSLPPSVPGGVIGSRGEALSFKSRQSSHTESIRFRSIAGGQAQFMQYPDDEGAGETKVVGYAKDGFPCGIALTYGGLKFLPSGSIHSVLVGGFDAEVSQATFDNLWPNADVPGNMIDVPSLFDQLFDSGIVSPSLFHPIPIRFTRRRTHDGPVYSLETDNGLIIANGVVTHNCRCIAIPIISTRQPGGAVEEPLFTDSPSAEGLTRESFVKRTDRTYVKEIQEQHRRHPQFRPDDSLPPGVRVQGARVRGLKSGPETRRSFD